MKTIGFDEIELVEVGNGISFAGTLWHDAAKDEHYILPCEEDVEGTVSCLKFSDTEKYNFINRAWLIESIRYTDFKRKLVKTALARSKSEVDPVIKWKVFRRDNFQCFYCGFSDGPLTYDHYTPQAAGGGTTVENGRTACRKCNKAKSDTDGDEWMQSERLKSIRKSREKKK